MGGGLSHFTRSNFYVIKKVPKQWEHWEDIPKSWNYSTQEVDYNFNSWDFNIWAIEKDDNKLMTLSFMIIYSHNIPGFYNIRSDTWYNVMAEIHALMHLHINPYHNFIHILDVMQTCNAFIRDFQAKLWLNELQIFCTLIAGLIHDLEHPGTNNLYQINAGTTLAVRYNDLAVLENHHCARAFELFNQPALNIFAALTSDQRRSARKYIIAMVLATDMSVHFSLKDEVENCVSRLIPLQQALPPDTTIKIEEKDALTIMKAIVHTADISNPAKRWEVSRKWSDRVNEEFFLQGDREKKESLAISPGCDRSIASQDEGSINFTDFIVAPFYFSITKLLPKAMKACRLLEDNRNTWNNILTQRLNSTQAESKVDEIIVKWESRKAAFTEKMKDLQACSAARVSADL
eukprot:gene1098-1191_t